MISWEGGLVIVIAIPTVVFIAAWIWPQRVPKDKSVSAIRDRVEGEKQQ
ncbi:hypothetical protein [Nocardia africana]|uniref:Uncharacterized protein n=1 Tax=Nocardia africana TaxID=134964 RepID=A0ABW6NK97_9NOCA